MGDRADSRYSCLSCGEGIFFLQRECENCGEAHDWFYYAPCRECETEINYLGKACEHCGEEYSPWRVIEMELIDTENPLSVAKDAVPRPSADSYQRHFGTIKGQWADYRRTLPDGSEFHVLVYLDHYEIHLDAVSAIDDPAHHVVRYAPRVVVLTGTGLIESIHKTIEFSGDLLSRSLKTSFELFADADDE